MWVFLRFLPRPKPGEIRNLNQIRGDSKPHKKLRKGTTMFQTQNSQIAATSTNNSNPTQHIDAISLVHMREIMNWVPSSEEEDPVFFAMKRVQQCVWLLRHSAEERCAEERCDDMLKIFKNIVTNKEAKANKAAFAATSDWCTLDGVYYPWPETIEEMDKALNEGLRLMRAESNIKRVGNKNPQRMYIMWDTLWEFTNNGNEDWIYDTEIIVRNPREYEEWLKRVVALVEEAFK